MLVVVSRGASQVTLLAGGCPCPWVANLVRKVSGRMGFLGPFALVPGAATLSKRPATNFAGHDHVDGEGGRFRLA